MTKKKTNSAATPRDFIGCTLKRLPDELLVEASETAVDINPANEAPARSLAHLFPGVMSPQHIALLRSKWWGASGVKLGVAFLDTRDASLKARLLSHMNAWGTRANVHFSEASAGIAQVRIMRTPQDGYWSYLGVDVLHIPKNQPTMNLDSFSMSTPEGEYRRVVRHETGHTLGFPHEHMRQEIVARLDAQKTISYFMATQGWSAQEVQQQVLTPLSDADIPDRTQADTLSIMCYNLPSSITIDGQPIQGGSDIDELDFTLAAKIYPQAVQPPAPPPGGAVTIAVPKAGTYQLVQ